MSRQKISHPTNIYWLYDMRLDVLATHGPRGCPFYCGKTVQIPKVRLRHHRSFAGRFPKRPSASRINQCGVHLRLEVVEVVPSDGDWMACEKAWIAALRMLYPADATNVSDGGESQTAGWKHKPETLAKIGAVHKGKKFSPERCARMSAERKGCIITPETRLKISAANKGQKRAIEFSQRQSAARKGLVKSVEHRAKLSTAALLRGHLTAATNRNRVWSEESRAKARNSALRRHAKASL